MCKYFQFTQENQGREVPEEKCELLKVHHRKNPSQIQLENELGNSTVLEHNIDTFGTQWSVGCQGKIILVTVEKPGVKGQIRYKSSSTWKQPIEHIFR